MQEQPALEPLPIKLVGSCYCGKVVFSVSTHPPPFKSLYCHCESCRRAHSAPLYHICYVPQECLVIDSGSDCIREYHRTN